jgi:hypothetical protein
MSRTHVPPSRMPGDVEGGPVPMDDEEDPASPGSLASSVPASPPVVEFGYGTPQGSSGSLTESQTVAASPAPAVPDWGEGGEGEGEENDDDEYHESSDPMLGSPSDLDLMPAAGEWEVPLDAEPIRRNFPGSDDDEEGDGAYMGGIV